MGSLMDAVENGFWSRSLANSRPREMGSSNFVADVKFVRSLPLAEVENTPGSDND